MTPEFALDPRLAADSVALADFPLCTVRLMNDARYPWLILVPRRVGAVEIIDLPGPDRAQLMDEIERASVALKHCVAAEKLNVAALGNVVAQLHVHVIARFRNDAAWPRPVWGIGSAEAYSAQALDERTAQLGAALLVQ